MQKNSVMSLGLILTRFWRRISKVRINHVRCWLVTWNGSRVNKFLDIRIQNLSQQFHKFRDPSQRPDHDHEIDTASAEFQIANTVHAEL
jgi:hypothetical protein